MVVTSVHLKAVVQVSETRLSKLDTNQSTIHENLLKSMTVLGAKARFVIGWTGYATPNVAQPGDTRDWLFKTLCEMNAPWLTAEQIMHLLSVQATAHFATFPPKDDKRAHFILGGWEISGSGELLPFVGVVSNFATGRNETRTEGDPRHHIPKYEESAAAAPEFRSWIERFENITDRHYVVNVMGSYKPAVVQEGFRGLEGLLKQQASAERIGAACRQIILEASEHSPSIGRNVIGVEMDSTGKHHCSYYSEQETDVIPVPDYLSTEGCYTRTTITQTADGKTHVQGKIAKAVANSH